jgi:Sulfotransferase domain
LPGPQKRGSGVRERQNVGYGVWGDVLMSPGQETAAEAGPGARAWADGRLAVPAATGWQLVGRRVAKWGLLTAGRPLHHLRMLPGFIIVGAERCGTTSMFGVLRQHPAVFNGTLPRKEVHYFDNRYGRGIGWYQCHFPVTVRARLAARGAGNPVAFEATANYMFHPLAPERINRDLPGVRLIVMVRDPVERAYSAHAHQVGFGYETEPFERALELEDSRVDGEAERIAADPGYESFSFDHYTYRARGHYADQLDHLEGIVGRDRILVVDSGDFFAEPGPCYDQVLGFLGLSHRGRPAFRPQNARPRAPMPGTVRAALDEHFRPHDERLVAWLGREPSWRR